AGAGATAGIGGTCGAAPASTCVTDWRATRTRMPSRSTSISLRPVSSSSFASSRIRSCSLTSPGFSSWKGWRLTFCLGADEGRKPRDRQRIAFRAETADHPPGALRDIGVMAVLLALVNVGDVHLYGRQLHGKDRIKD